MACECIIELRKPSYFVEDLGRWVDLEQELDSTLRELNTPILACDAVVWLYRNLNHEEILEGFFNENGTQQLNLVSQVMRFK